MRIASYKINCLSLVGSGKLEIQFFQSHFVEVFHKAKAIAASFQRTNGFLKSFLVVFTNGHDLAYSLHLCTQLILGAFEFFDAERANLITT